MRRPLLLLALLGATAAAPAADILRAPEGQFSDGAKILSADSARMIRIRQDFFTRATGCPLYIATLPSADGASLTDKAQEVFTRWHATEKRLPDESILLLAFAAEKKGRLVLGTTVPKEYEDALSDLPALTWTDPALAGRAIDALVFDLDKRLEAPAQALNRRRAAFIPPVPRMFVLDGNGRFFDADRDRMEKDLAALAKSTGHTILAVIDPPGLTLALGDFGDAEMKTWSDAAFESWRQDRPELDNGAVLFVFTSKFEATIACAKKLAPLVPRDVLADLTRDVRDGQVTASTGRTIVRVAETLDRRFAGKKTISVRSPLWLALHPWRLFSGPDEQISLGFAIFSAAFLLALVGRYVYLWITHPKMMLFQLAGFALAGVIGGAVSNAAGETVGEVAGKFVGGMGSFGGGGASGSW